MPKLKHYWLLDTAKAFGMEIDEFVAYMGYSRNTIYSAAKGYSKLAKGRLANAIFKLEMLNEKLLKAERKQAVDNYEARKKMIEDLMERLG